MAFCGALHSPFLGQALLEIPPNYFFPANPLSNHDLPAAQQSAKVSNQNVPAHTYSAVVTTPSSSWPAVSESHSQRGSDWKTLCATINGQVASQLTKERTTNGVDVLRINSYDQAASLVVPHRKDVADVAVSNLPRPLSISDLVPVPMNGSTLRVSYKGVPGAYSEAAAAKAYPACEPVPCDQFDSTLQSVERWLADRAVLPLENSLAGSVHRNYDLLLRHRLHIVGEVQLSAHHCLLAVPGVAMSDLRRVISHPLALSQCENTLTRHLGLSVALEAVDDTAGAAQFIAENNVRDTAAIASSRAAEIYGMNVLAEGIQDDACNLTRFVMLAREPIIPRVDRPFKTSIVVATEEKTGSLLKVLSAFALRDINLTKIESRPLSTKPMRSVDGTTTSGKTKQFEYLFYIDFEASMADKRAQNALAQIQEYTSFLRVLGSYPMDITP